MLMKRSIVLVGIIAVVSGAMRAEDHSQNRLQQELAAVLKWEILWDDSPAGFQLPRDGKAQVSLLGDSNSLSYCSTRLGVCARYRTDLNRNWMGVAKAKIKHGQADYKTVVQFASKNLGISQRGDSVAGSLPQPSTFVWEAVINLGSREDIIQQYRQMRPQGIGALEDWIRVTRSSEVKSITIACFAPSDPVVYYFVDRPAKESAVMAAYWDREHKQWFVAASLVRSQGPETFERMRRTIESVACSTLD
jgi:hypothetical protein